MSFLLSSFLRQPQTSAAAEKTADVCNLYSFALSKDGKTDIHVGELTIKGVTDPSSIWKPSPGGEPYIFLSHRGPDSKESIIRPTSWFLSEILGVKTFFDDKSMRAGEEQMRSLIEPAYLCTHALVLITPNFRTSEYCVKELNTFMMRREKGLLTLIPALWNLTDMHEAQGFNKTVREVNWMKPGENRDAGSFMVDKLWPFLVDNLEKSTRYSLRGLLLEYVEKSRKDDTTPPIPKCLEKWYAENAAKEDLEKSMAIGQVFEERNADEYERGSLNRGESGSVASVFSSCSSITNISVNSASSIASFKHVPIKAFGRSSDDQSGIKDYQKDSEWRYTWTHNPEGIVRDVANAFYYNAYVTYFKVQRVVVVDEKAKQLLICTPMNWAAYYIMKELRGEVHFSMNRAYERGLVNARATELDAAFKYMHYRRCEAGRELVYSNEECSLTVRIIHQGAEEHCWVIDGFPENGGWGKFLHSLLNVKIKWVAVVCGETGIRNNKGDDGSGWSLIFRDEEAELLMGEHRTFGERRGLQFRGGTYGTFYQNGMNDVLVVPQGRLLFMGHDDRRAVGNAGEKIWKLDMETVGEDLE